MKKYVDVILPLPLPKSFTYSLPDECAEDVKIGCRVVVPFGRKKFYTAIVLNVHYCAPTEYEVKDISALLDASPILLPAQFKFWEWIADYYLCTQGDVYKAALPSGLKLESETIVEYNPDFEADAPLPEREQRILDLLAVDSQQCVTKLEKDSGISVLDAIYKFQKLDAERCHVTDSLSESHKKLIAFWGMLGNGLEQDEFYTWKYRGRPIRLGEIPPLPLDMQKPMPDAGKEIEVDFKLNIKHDGIYISTNLPDNYQLFGKINGRYSFNNIVVKSGNAQIPLSDKISEVYAVDLYSVVPTISGVDSSIIGEKARNLVGQYVKFSPISGNSIEFHYKK